MEKRPPLSARHQNRLSRFLSKDYRDGFLETDVKGGIAYQIQALREKTGLSQAAFAEKTGKKQSVISRLEDTEYGGVNVNTLLEIAKALDIGLQVRFCDYIDVLERDISPAGMKVDTIFETMAKLRTVVIDTANSTPKTIKFQEIGGVKCPQIQQNLKETQYHVFGTRDFKSFMLTNSSSTCLPSTSH